MSRRTKIILVIVAVALFLLVFWLLLRRRGDAPISTGNQPANAVNSQKGLLNTGTTTAVNTASATNVPVVTPSPKPPTEANLGRLAAVFAERYGSYSNTDNDFANLLDLKVFMSVAMIGRTDAYIAKQQGMPPAKEHYGVTTRAINTSTTTFADARAELKVKTQRQEFIGNTPNGKVKYQDIDVVFVKEGEVWKVDSATWN